MDSSSSFAGILVGQPTLAGQLRMGMFAALDQRIADRRGLAAWWRMMALDRPPRSTRDESLLRTMARRRRPHGERQRDPHRRLRPPPSAGSANLRPEGLPTPAPEAPGRDRRG